jgi:glutathione synthase/RimK-type ligase-like ATP-grasp enzyme
MATIGILAGRERAFTDALIAQLNAGGAAVAEYAIIGGVRMAEEPGYRVILDRISYAVPFFQSYLKSAAVMGCQVVNDPFWQLAEDKFLDVSIALAAGLRAPRTALLPNREHVPGVVEESLRNRADPLDWEAAMAWVGFPLIMRPHWGAGSRKAFLIHTPEELKARWEHSGQGQFILQEWLTGARYVHCLTIGDDALAITRPMRQAPEQSTLPAISTADADHVSQTAVALAQALGYHMNAVEFALRDGEIFATDWLNYAPPVEPAGLTATEFEWAVDRSAGLLARLAELPEMRRYRWDGLSLAVG